MNKEIEQQLEALSQMHKKMLAEFGKVIVGQSEVLDELLITIFAGGHNLLEGVPGLAKTLMISTLSRLMSLRLQAHPVHARPDAVRHHRHQRHRGRSHHRQARDGVRLRPDLHQRGAGGRDQPHAAEDAGRALLQAMQEQRSHRRRQDLRPRPRRSSSWPRKTRSTRKAPTRCPRRRRIVSSSTPSSSIRSCRKRKTSSIGRR